MSDRAWQTMAADGAAAWAAEQDARVVCKNTWPTPDDDGDEDDEPLTWWDLHEDEVMEERAIRGYR